MANITSVTNPSDIVRPLVAWDPDVVRMTSDEQAELFTWGQYQRMLGKARRRKGNKDEIGCENWTALAIFDFLLQVRMLAKKKKLFARSVLGLK